MIDPEILHVIEIEIIPTVETETIQMIEIINIKSTDHEKIRKTHQITKDQNYKIINIHHVKVQRIEIQIMRIDNEIILNQHIGITRVLKTHKNTIGAVHLNIKDN